jgi:autotransporter strand-loop-strand O-heptosyltransferase
MTTKTPKGNNIALSFFDGARMEVRGEKDADYLVEFWNSANGLLVYSTEFAKRSPSHWAMPEGVYFIPWRVVVSEDGIQVLDYTLNLTGQRVYVQLNSSALGDTLAWIPYAEEFRKKHQCEMHVATFHNKIFDGAYPDMAFEKPGAGGAGAYFAGYIVGTFDGQYAKNKNHWRTIPLQQVASDFLGLEYQEIKPKVKRAETAAEQGNYKYVAIAEFSTFDCKQWLNPNGWAETVAYLTARGLKVVSVSTENTGLQGVIAMNGKPIEETIRNIQHAEFFIGVSSGCSWLAWGLNVPVVLISGSTEEFTEMTDCNRVINKTVCHGCINDKEVPFDRGNRKLCPRNKNFECSTSITFEMVKVAIDSVFRDLVHNLTEKYAPPMHHTQEQHAKNQEGVLFLLPHCSTGGLPQYAYHCVRDLRNFGVPVTVIEWNDYGHYDVQRKRLQAIADYYILSGNKMERLQQIIADFNPSVVHLQEFPEYFLSPEEARWLYRPERSYRLVETSHGTEVVSVENKKYRPDAFIFASEYHVKKYATFGVPSSVAEYRAEPQVRPNRTEALAKLGIDPSRKHVLNIGLFTPGKNQGELFEIARKLPDILFHFVGNQAPNFADYWKPLMQNKPANCIIWGERNDVDLFYASMDLFYFASTVEFNPIVIKEALAWQMPIMMRNLETYRLKYVDHSLVAFIKENDDIESLTLKLRAMFWTIACDLQAGYSGLAKLVDLSAASLPIPESQEPSQQPENAREQVIPGWFDPANQKQLESLIKQHDIHSVIEIGSFLGLSAAWFAKHPQIEYVTCIDTWDTADAEKNDPDLFAAMSKMGLHGDFLPRFIENMKAAGVWDKITVVRGESRKVFRAVADLHDLAYIDADHTENGCGRDIDLYGSKARKIICGDDYVDRPGFGVIRAVEKELYKHYTIGPFWWAYAPGYVPKVPKVAVIIPNLNMGKTLKRAILSAQAQTVPASEIIVVDGGSSDDSEPICKDLGVQFMVERNGKMARAKNVAARVLWSEEGRCEYIVPLDADDWIDPSYIERCLEQMTEGVGVVSTQLRWPDDSIQIPDPPFTVERLLERNRLFSCSMIRLEALASVGWYDEHPQLFEDWLLWGVMVADGWQIGIVPEPLFHFTSRNCGDRDERMALETEEAYRRETIDRMRTYASPLVRE